jgi:hypothetical protein
MNQIHLNGKQCSGRGVRFKSLPPDESDKISADAAKLIGSEGTFVELKKTEWRMGVRKMIREVTVEGGLKTCMGDDVKWQKVTPMSLDSDFDKLFTSKDAALLAAVYREYHEVNEKDIEDIVGKALAVSEG